MVQDTHENFLMVLSRFKDLEWDYACQENVEYEQLSAFMATMQLLANYSHTKENRRTL